jgi:hypothetical protein
VVCSHFLNLCWPPTRRYNDRIISGRPWVWRKEFQIIDGLLNTCPNTSVSFARRMGPMLSSPGAARQRMIILEEMRFEAWSRDFFGGYHEGLKDESAMIQNPEQSPTIQGTGNRRRLSTLGHSRLQQIEEGREGRKDHSSEVRRSTQRRQSRFAETRLQKLRQSDPGPGRQNANPGAKAGSPSVSFARPDSLPELDPLPMVTQAESNQRRKSRLAVARLQKLQPASKTNSNASSPVSGHVAQFGQGATQEVSTSVMDNLRMSTAGDEDEDQEEDDKALTTVMNSFNMSTIVDNEDEDGGEEESEGSSVTENALSLPNRRTGRGGESGLDMSTVMKNFHMSTIVDHDEEEEEESSGEMDAKAAALAQQHGTSFSEVGLT